MAEGRTAGIGFMTLLIITLVVVALWRDWGGIRSNLFSTQTNANGEEITSHVTPPPSWCPPNHTIGTPTHPETPQTNTIIGWDTNQSCCKKQITGYNCAINTPSKLEYCITGDVGGETKYAKINGHTIANTTLIPAIISHTHKTNTFKECDSTGYPKPLVT